jgi:hypothetical protein
MTASLQRLVESWLFDHTVGRLGRHFVRKFLQHRRVGRNLLRRYRAQMQGRLS